MANFTTREDLEIRLGAKRVRELFDDDRDGVLNDAEVGVLNEILSEANDTVTGMLLGKAWTEDQLDGMSADRSLRRAACQIAAQLAGERRPEFRNDQDAGPYDAQGERGRKFLQSFAKGEQRSRLEPSVGTNKSIRGRVSRQTPNTIFGRDPLNPNDRMGDGKGF